MRLQENGQERGNGPRQGSVPGTGFLCRAGGQASGEGTARGPLRRLAPALAPAHSCGPATRRGFLDLLLRNPMANAAFSSPHTFLGGMRLAPLHLASLQLLARICARGGSAVPAYVQRSAARQAALCYKLFLLARRLSHTSNLIFTTNFYLQSLFQLELNIKKSNYISQFIVSLFSAMYYSFMINSAASRKNLIADLFPKLSQYLNQFLRTVIFQINLLKIAKNQ